MKELWTYLDATGVLALLLGGLWVAHKVRSIVAGRRAKSPRKSPPQAARPSFPRLLPKHEGSSHVLRADLSDAAARPDPSDS